MEKNISELYQSILDRTETAIAAHDLKTGEIFYINKAMRRIYEIEGELENFSLDSRLLLERGKKHLDLDYEALKNGASNEAIEYHDSGRIYQVKGTIIDWNGREAYLEYLSDVTDSKLFHERLQLERQELQRKYQEEVLYREKAISEDIIASTRINLSYGYVEEMRVGMKDGYETEYQNVMDVLERMKAFTNKVWMTEAQKEKMSPKSLLNDYWQGKRHISEEFMVELKGGRHVWMKSDIKLLQRPETAEIIAFCYHSNITREKILTGILERIMSFDYDEIFTIDLRNGKMSLVAAGRSVIEEQPKESDYAEELQKLLLRVKSKQRAKRLEKKLSLENIVRKLETDKVYLTEVSLLSENGKSRLKQLRFVYLQEELGILLFTIADIEEMVQAKKQKQKELEQALEAAKEASAAKGRFLANMSHEIRTPMNVIIGLSSIIKEEAANQEVVLENAERLEAFSKYLLSLLNDVLDMARVETGSTSLNKQEFSMEQYWKAVNTIGESQAKKAGVHYIFKQEAGMQKYYIGDAVRLQQILINLISNAIKFTPRDGSVTVYVKQLEQKNQRAKIQMQVIDTGIGISKEFLPKLFQVFSQEHDATTSSYGGSGLGLSIAKNFAKLMEGDITVDSTEGEGTTFTVTVWLEVPEVLCKKDLKEKVIETEKLNGKRILLAEDHPVNTIVAKRLLEKQKIEVVHAENGKKAFDLFAESKENSFDAILMDVRMPVMDGIAATKEIRALSRADAKKIPIIAMTANAFDEDKQQTYEAGMNAHLAKPIDPMKLYETLVEYITI